MIDPKDFYCHPMDGEKMREWNPIGTAPKDGTWILTCCSSWLYIPTALHWDEYRWWDDADEPETGRAVEWQPTHWMPLPEPPK